MEREEKMQAVLGQAIALMAQGRTMTFDAFAGWLSARGFTSNYGTPYRGGRYARGVARLVDAAYNYAHDELGRGEAGAAPIAQAFTEKNGEPAYD